MGGCAQRRRAVWGNSSYLRGRTAPARPPSRRCYVRSWKNGGIAFRKLEFPRYQEESSALIRLYLGGAFGSDPDDVNAYAASAFYSVDRYASYKQDWGGFYESGGC